MNFRSEKSRELYLLLEEKGYEPGICEVIAGQMNTDYTAGRMIGYLSYFEKPGLEDIADEMLAILEERNLFAQKHEYFRTNSEWNEYLNSGIAPDDEE